MPQSTLLPLWAQSPELSPLNGLDVTIETDDDLMPRLDPESGAMEIPMADGSVVIDLNPRRPSAKGDFDANLAEDIDEGELARISSELLEGIEADDQSRQEWLNMRAKGIDLLGLKLEEPRSDAGSSSAPLEGMSTVRHPLLLEACLRFQANARGELLPADGPVKVKNEGPKTGPMQQQADMLEDDMNAYLTSTASEYYPDTDRMLFMTGFGGMMFKKVYACPLRNRPVSESVDAADIIVSNATTDLANAGRVTHRVKMRKSVLRRMQLAGAYREVPLTLPQPDNDKMDKKINQLQGTQMTQLRPQDQDYTIYECYCELDIKGYEHKEDGEETGLPLPFKVTIEKDSRQILEIRRNWREGDETYRARKTFVPYCFVPGLGFYGIGFLQILGNTSTALTASWRLMLDAGMFANFPGFLYAVSGQTRQKQNQFRVPPGGGAPIDTNGMAINQAVMALPYKEAGSGLMSLTENVAQMGQRLGGTAETQIGEGVQDAPVGTTLALIEQATKIESAVHKRLHAAQAEEFQMLKELFKADPGALTRYGRANPAWNEAAILRALDNFDLIPMADPNTPSHMHRIVIAMAIKQLQQLNPQLYDAKAVDLRILGMLKVDDAESLFAPPPPPMAAPGPDPAKLADVQQRNQDSVRKFTLGMAKIAADREKTEQQQDTEVLKLAQTMAIHPESTETSIEGARAAKGLVQ